MTAVLKMQPLDAANDNVELDEPHRRELEASGLTNETIGAVGDTPRYMEVAQIQIELLEKYFFNRNDTVAYAMKFGEKPDRHKLEAEARPAKAHVEGHYRAGSYCLSTASTAKWTCIDFDGLGHKSALADPDAAALKSQEIAAGLGLPMYLEKSGSTGGWHGWIFYAQPIPGALAREVGLALVPPDVALTKGGIASPLSNKGIEVFPKQAKIAEGGYGNMVWLPFYPHAAAGGNLFYRKSESDALEVYQPRDFVTVTLAEAEVVAAKVRLTVEEDKASSAKKQLNQEQDDIDTTGVWKAWRKEALARLPLDKVYGEFTTGKKSGSGWLECRDPSSGTGDRNPSAGVADDVEGVERGSFHSFLSGRTVGVFDFLMEHRDVSSFSEGQRIVADLSGVPTPKRAADPYQNTSAEWVVEHCVPMLNRHFVLLRAADGTERFYSLNERREATLLLKQMPLEQALHDFLKRRFDRIPPQAVLTAAIVLWKKEGEKLGGEPEPFCFRGDERLCFKRFDWEPTAGEFAAWDEFLNRLSDRDAFMAYVWSVFEKKNESRQYAWLRGEGQDGKSKVFGVLLDVFGKEAAIGISNSHLSKDNRFLFSSLYGKRMAIYSDCKNPKLGMSEFIRNCTSGDEVLVEYKNQNPFSAKMYLKLFVGSNIKPQLTGQNADVSRMLYIEVDESKNKDDPSWAERLRGELPAFLFACRETYTRLCSHHGNIPINESSQALRDGAAVAFEEHHYEIFDVLFTATPHGSVPALTVRKLAKGMGINSNEQMADFKMWMERVHRVRYVPGKKCRSYEGLALSREGAALDLAVTNATYGDGRR